MCPEHEMGMKRFALGAGIGLSVGFVMGILLAPRSGSETINGISDGVKQAAKAAKDDISAVGNKIKDNVDHISGAVTKVEKNTREGITRGIKKVLETMEETADAAKEGIENLVKA